MKTIGLIILMTMAFWFRIEAQEGYIHYTETVKLKIDIPEDQKELFKNMPQTQQYKKTLAFNAITSLYKDDLGNEDLDLQHEQDGMDMQIKIKKPESYVYLNLQEKVYLNSQEFFGRYFLISEATGFHKWKVTGEQKKVLDYQCIRAETEGENGTIVAWFAPKLQVGIGPNGLNGLPGTILAVEMENGDRTIIAHAIDMKQVKEGDIVKPEKGKKVSRQEFNKIRDEKLKEMGATGGKGIRMIINEERH